MVESVRIDGKPCQRHVAWIASITESANEIVSQRRYFWDDVHERLDRLGNRISVEDRRHIEAAIARKVPGFHAKNTTRASRPRLRYGLRAKAISATDVTFQRIARPI